MLKPGETGAYQITIKGQTTLQCEGGTSTTCQYSVLAEKILGTGAARSFINFATATGAYFNQVVSRHFSLMVAATVPFKGGGGGSITGEPFVIPLPRAILSAQLRITVQALARLQDVRIVAFPADELDVKTIPPD